MATPVINPLPAAPTRADGATDFSAKADAMIAALPPMVVQLNSSFAWQAGVLAGTQAARDAASTSAITTAGSVTSAAQQVSLASEQRVLAEQAKSGADSAKNSAEVAAAAAQAAAGLPTLAGNSRKVLGVRQDESGVEWVLGLPSMAGNGGKILQVNPAGTQAQWVILGSCLVVDEKASGTRGGTATPGAYFTRTLNTIRHDSIGVSLSGNAISLPAGSYLITATAPAAGSSFHKIRLYDQTNSAVLAVGTTENSGGTNVSTRSKLTKLISVSSPISVRIEHRIAENNTANAVLGSAASFGDSEVFSEMLIQKVQ